MSIKSLFLGIVIGLALGVGVMWVFGDQIRGDVSDARQEVGQTVRDAGKTLEKAGDKIK